jgi:hypothetical protein
MNANWFEGKVKYIRIGEDGRERKVAEVYLLDAMSYTEAESRIIREMEGITSGEFWITGLKKSNVTEVVYTTDVNDDRWYKAKVAIVDADEVSGREKRSFLYYLVAASDASRALENLNKALETFVVPWEVVGVSDSQVADVFHYVAEGED